MQSRSYCCGMKKILFLHGLESSPGGKKSKYLQSLGYEVLNPALPKDSFEESCLIAQNLVDEENPDVIVGSSRGGAVALSIDPGAAPLVLIAPAWKRYGVGRSNLRFDTTIIHSREDEVIPYEESEELIEGTFLAIHEYGKDHRMNHPEVMLGLLFAIEGSEGLLHWSRSYDRINGWL